MRFLKRFTIVTLALLCLDSPAAEYELINPQFNTMAGWNSSLDKAQASADESGLKLKITEKPQSPWKIQLRQPIHTAFYPGETVQIRLKGSSDSAQEIAIALQSTKPPFSSIIFSREQLPSESKWISYTGKVDQLVPSGESQLTLTCGYGKGTISIEDIKLTLPGRSNISDTPAAFSNMEWPKEKLPIIALEKYPLPKKGSLPNGPFRSIIEGVTAFKLQGPKWATLEQRTVSGQPFEHSVLLTTKEETPKIYSVQAKQPLVYSARKGDVMLAVFSFRMETPNPETGYASLMFALEEIGGRYEKLFQWGETMHNGEWRHAIVPFRLDRDVTAGAVQVVMRAGFGPQAVEIGETALINLGPDSKPWNLKQTRMTYGGNDPSAAWRTEAAQRIETVRKGNFKLTVPNATAGVPIIGKLVRHHFSFGSTLNAKALLSGAEKYNADYGPTAAKTFNAGSLENSMKWTLEDAPGIEQAIDKSLSWMEQNDWHIRGHVLIWPSWRYSPGHLQKLKDRPETLRKEIIDRITRTTERWAGRIDDWDVINEPFTNHDFMDLLGRMEMAEWLRAARKGAPGADLYINDFDLIVRPGSGNPKIPYHMELIGDLKEEGAPLDGFGIQSHFVGILTPIEHVLSMLDDFAATGVKLQITELTINVPDEMTQADYARDFITAAFSCPSVNLIQTWGFWEGRMFEPPAAMFRQNWDPKSLYEKWDRLINETFSSSVSATTDADGTLFFRGFYGTYEFTLPGGKTVQVEFTPDTLEQTL